MMSNRNSIPTTDKSTPLSPKLQKIIRWIVDNAGYFESAQFAKIVLNLKNENIVGEINVFPDHKL